MPDPETAPSLSFQDIFPESPAVYIHSGSFGSLEKSLFFKFFYNLLFFECYFFRKLRFQGLLNPYDSPELYFIMEVHNVLPHLLSSKF